MSLLTKAINVGVLLLAFSRPIRILLERPTFASQIIADEASAGLALGGKFDVGKATQFYGPMVAAIVLKKAISMVRRTARI